MTTTDANGDFIVRTTPDRSIDILATRIFIDTNGSISGIPGAKVIEFGKLADIPLIGLVTRSCNSAVVTNPVDTGSTTPVKVIIGNVGTVNYSVSAWVTSGTGGGAFAYIYELLPNGEPNQSEPASGAKVVLTGPDNTTITLAELVANSGYYYAAISITVGARYTLSIDMGSSGSIGGSGSVYAVGDVVWTSPSNGSTTSSAGLTASWSDTGSVTPGYSVLYWAFITNTSSSTVDFATYTGSNREFLVKSGLNPANNLMPGEYVASVYAFSGPYALGANSDFDITNNITGSTVSGQFYSWSGGGQSAAATFTLN